MEMEIVVFFQIRFLAYVAHCLCGALAWNLMEGRGVALSVVGLAPSLPPAANSSGLFTTSAS
jgi:hypothetical protein